MANFANRVWCLHFDSISRISVVSIEHRELLFYWSAAAAAAAAVVNDHGNVTTTSPYHRICIVIHYTRTLLQEHEILFV